MKETASQSDKADRRYTGLKLGVLNKKLDKLSRYLEVRFLKIQSDIHTYIHANIHTYIRTYWFSRN